MPSLLVVDDEIEIRELLRTACARQGYTTTTVPGVEQALEALSKQPFDLVILDAHVEGKLGADTIRRIRSAKNPVPVLVYTGGVTQQEEAEFRAAGAYDIVLKNAGVLPLMEMISKIFTAGIKPADAARPSMRTVLVTDDDSSVRQVLRRFLESRHFAVIEADSGLAAVEAVRAHALTAVFLDVNMPGELDGIAALREIRLIRPELGVIMVTGEQDDRTVGRAVELGASGYVVKPFDFLYLEMMLLSKIDNQR